MPLLLLLLLPIYYKTNLKFWNMIWLRNIIIILQIHSLVIPINWYIVYVYSKTQQLLGLFIMLQELDQYVWLIFTTEQENSVCNSGPAFLLKQQYGLLERFFPLIPVSFWTALIWGKMFSTTNSSSDIASSLALKPQVLLVLFHQRNFFQPLVNSGNLQRRDP